MSANGEKRAGATVLQALAAAALGLPGLVMSGTCRADNDGVEFQYSHYSEGARDILGRAGAGRRLGRVTDLDSKFDPIEVDSLHLRGNAALAARLSVIFDYQQDTWAGASPVGTAPAVIAGNRLFRDLDPADGIHVGSGASPLLYQGRIRTVAERLGLFVADPLPGFLAQPDRTTLFIPFDHAHFSRVGYAEVASVAADALRSRFDALPRPVDLLTSTTAVGAPGTPAAPVAPVSPAVPTVR